MRRLTPPHTRHSPLEVGTAFDRCGHPSEFPPPFSFPESSFAVRISDSTQKESLGKEMALQVNDSETSTAVTIEGGTQDAQNVTCCICLENLTQGGISTVTNCKHQYHLQCILEWCQRSSSCPTCRREVSLDDTESQYLLEAVAHERIMKAKTIKYSTVQFTREDLTSSSRLREAEFQERLNQYMASMGRRYQFSMSDDQSNASRNSDGKSSGKELESAGTYEFQAFSDSLRSMTMRYRDSILNQKDALLARFRYMA